MQLLLVATIACGLLICQTQSENYGLWTGMRPRSNTRPLIPSEQLPPYDILHDGNDADVSPMGNAQAFEQADGYYRRGAIADLRADIIRTFVGKIKEFLRTVMAVFDAVRRQMDKIGWSNSSRLLSNLIEAVQKFSDRLGRAEQGPYEGRKRSQNYGGTRYHQKFTFG